MTKGGISQKQLFMLRRTIFTWWDPEADICTRFPSEPSARTADACGSGPRAS